MNDPRPADAELVLRSSRWKWFGWFLFCLATTGVSVWLIHDASGWYGWLMGWFGAIVCGLLTPVLLVQTIWNIAYLQLTPEGFTTRSWYGKDFLRWTDVTGFQTYTQFASGFPIRTAIGFDFSESYPCNRRKDKLSPSRARLQVALTGGTDIQGGYDAYLPDTYGMKAEELAELLNDWRERYALR